LPVLYDTKTRWPKNVNRPKCYVCGRMAGVKDIEWLTVKIVGGNHVYYSPAVILFYRVQSTPRRKDVCVECLDKDPFKYVAEREFADKKARRLYTQIRRRRAKRTKPKTA
jgi:hypothetical protein